ncbi:class I adenylate-forming enzyme family protein [Brevibacterium moorei]|uniref:class I adenylate-forming enzyme family protein n=1 Tax=Brevibacterium moorei TaxID=2968457 RepID=UPI00211BB208|nr:class I adenylate-forming enzyme family protein [Brevibacterium sp. 68QC2CO]MCQ9385383.1 acyl--CoA ligase [Brevibacterium sp. 68QC2CO]
MPITRKILEVADSTPDLPAIVGPAPGESLSYAQLVTDSAHMFKSVSMLHAEQSDPPAPAPETGGIPITAVSLKSAYHSARIVAGLAGFRAVSATVDPRWPMEHQVHVITSTGIGLVITDSPDLPAALANAGWTGTAISLKEFHSHESQWVDGFDDLAQPTVRDGAEPFLMLFSSGTTSAPKAFLKTREQYRNNFAVSSAYLEPDPQVQTLAPGPMSYSLTLYALIECLASGGSIHVADEFAPIEIGTRIAQEKISRIVAVPAVVQGLAAAALRDPERFTSVNLMVVGGANLSARTRDLVGAVLPDARLVSYYGAAELGFIGDSRDGDGTLISIYDGIKVQIRDPKLALSDGPAAVLPDGELGEIWISGGAVSDGYVSSTSSEHLRDAAGWGTVHDMGRIVDGKISLAGRAGDIIATGGHKVSLPEVERAFETLAGLNTVCAVALPSESLGQIVALAIEERVSHSKVGKSSTFPSKSELIMHARANLAPQFVPRRWYKIDKLPRTVGGKIRRGATAELIVLAESGGHDADQLGVQRI